MQHMNGIIPHLFDYWADTVVHLLPLKSSMGSVTRSGEFLVFWHFFWSHCPWVWIQSLHFLQITTICLVRQMHLLDSPYESISQSSIDHNSNLFLSFDRVLYSFSFSDGEMVSCCFVPLLRCMTSAFIAIDSIAKLLPIAALFTL